MKNKLLLWGTNQENEKVLLALELRPEENKVDIWSFPEAIVTEDFSKAMMNDWKAGKEVTFPEGYTHMERELAVSDSLLPEEIRVERGDVVQRAQTEWHFVVLSSKLNQAYKTELHELKERVDKLERYDASLWDELKSFWDKVQEQVRDRNLFREHADSLRDSTNELFGKLKELRSMLDKEFQNKSQSLLDNFMQSLDDIEERISKGMRLQNIFEDLKELQRKFRDLTFTREHRTQVWSRLDAAFKNIKERRFGPGATAEGSATERIQRRFEGLVSAIEKMQSSIDRDKEELNFQNKKIASTDGQLEAQIRQAKIMMIEERIRSKEEKLKEMNDTRNQLLGQIDAAKNREAKRHEKEKEKEKIEQAKKAVQDKIAAEIKQASEARSEDSEKLEKASEAILGGGKGESATPEAEEKPELTLTEQVEEVVEDVVDTAKAVASVVGEKVTSFMDTLLGEEEAKPEAENTAETPAEESTEDKKEA